MSKKPKYRGLPVPDALILDLAATKGRGSLVAASVLWKYGNPRRPGDPLVWPGLSELRARSGLHERTLRRALKDLKKRGWIEPAISPDGGLAWRLLSNPGEREVVEHPEPEEEASDGVSRPVPTTHDRRSGHQWPGDRPPTAAQPATTGRPLPYRKTEMKKSLSKTGGERAFSDSRSPATNEVPPRSFETREPIEGGNDDVARTLATLRAVRPPEGQSPIILRDTHVRDALKDFTPERLMRLVEHMRDAIEAGDRERRFWGPLALDGAWLGTCDAELATAAPKGPDVTTIVEARAWAEEHGGKLTGSGWEWQLDGRGGQFPVRAGAAGGGESHAVDGAELRRGTEEYSVWMRAPIAVADDAVREYRSRLEPNAVLGGIHDTPRHTKGNDDGEGLGEQRTRTGEQGETRRPDAATGH